MSFIKSRLRRFKGEEGIIIGHMYRHNALQGGSYR